MARFSVVLCFALMICGAVADEDGDAPVSVTLQSLKKLRIPELKKFLAERGQTCDGCAEKSDFVDLAL